MERPRYRELAPGRLPEPLRGLVECAWRAEVPPDGPLHEKNVLPDGCMDLLVIDDEIVVAGPDTAAHTASRTPGSIVTGLRFRPGHLPVLLGAPASELRDSRVALADLSMRTRRLAAGGGGAARPATPSVELFTVAAQLLRHPGEREGRPALPRHALDLLRRGGTAAAVADDLGCTTRTLHRHCLDTLGYGPATVRRVLRFRTAADLLHAGVAPAEAAARAGYADQPHLSREVRAMAGVSPARLAPDRRAQPVQANRSSDDPSGYPGPWGSAGPTEPGHQRVGVEPEPQPAPQRHLDGDLGVGRGRDLQPSIR